MLKVSAARPWRRLRVYILFCHVTWFHYFSRLQALPDHALLFIPPPAGVLDVWTFRHQLWSSVLLLYASCCRLELQRCSSHFTKQRDKKIKIRYFTTSSETQEHAVFPVGRPHVQSSPGPSCCGAGILTTLPPWRVQQEEGGKEKDVQLLWLKLWITWPGWLIIFTNLLKTCYYVKWRSAVTFVS